MHLILIATAVLLFSVPATAQISYASSPLIIFYGWGTYSSPITVRPGYTNQPFTVVLSPSPQYQYAALSLKGTPFTNSSGGYTAYSLPSQGSVFQFLLNVGRSARAGTYRVNFTVYYADGLSFSELLNVTVSPPPDVSVVAASWSGPDQFPAPGTGLNELTLVIGNPDRYPVSFVNLTIALPDALTSVSGQATAHAFAPYVGAGSFYDVSVPINVTQLSAPGKYEANYTLSFLDYQGVSYSENGSFPIYVYPASNVSVSVSPAAAPQYSTFMIYLEIRNQGSTLVKDVSITPEYQGPVLLSTNYTHLSLIQPGSSVSFYYEFSDVGLQPGPYPIDFQVIYQTLEGAEKVLSFNSYVLVTPGVNFVSVSLNTSELCIMRNNTVSLTVSNVGTGQVKQVQVDVVSPQGLAVYGAAGPVEIGTLQPGETREVSLTLMPLTGAPAVYPLEVVVSYVNPYEITQQQDFSFTLFAHGEVKIDFTDVTFNSTAFNGSTLYVSGTLINEGTEQAYYGTIYVFIPALNTSASSYIGDLPVDSPTPFSAYLSIPPGAKPGSYRVVVSYVYQDP
ncbi:MAG: COG1361 S-layer family protein [Nitrososphaeria archaeon]